MAAPGSPPAATPEIRLARAEDAAFIVSLTARFAGAGVPDWHDPARMAIFFERGIGEIAEAVAANRVAPDEAILIASMAGESLGFIHLRSQASGLTLEPQGYVNALATTAEAEGRGIGRASMIRRPKLLKRTRSFVRSSPCRARRRLSGFAVVLDSSSSAAPLPGGRTWVVKAAGSIFMPTPCE